MVDAKPQRKPVTFERSRRRGEKDLRTMRRLLREAGRTGIVPWEGIAELHRRADQWQRRLDGQPDPWLTYLEARSALSARVLAAAGTPDWSRLRRLYLETAGLPVEQWPEQARPETDA